MIKCWIDSRIARYVEQAALGSLHDVSQKDR